MKVYESGESGHMSGQKEKGGNNLTLSELKRDSHGRQNRDMELSWKI